MDCLYIYIHKFNFSRLPRNENVLSRLLTLNCENPNKSNANDVATTVTYIWVLSNIYTKNPKYIERDAEKLYEQYRSL